MLDRRKLLSAAAATPALAVTAGTCALGRAAVPARRSLRHAADLADRFVQWQGPYGRPDPKVYPYRTSRPFDAVHLHDVGPMARALYQLYEATKSPTYKSAADRYALFLLNTVHDPPTPMSSTLTLGGKKVTSMSRAWMYGKALSPCYEWFRRFNPGEDAFDRKAAAIYRWLQKHRRPDSYFGVGYPCPGAEDAQFSCDLGEVGQGLVGYYRVSRDPAVLADAAGLARFFLTDYVAGSGKGVWSPRLRIWLVGPWPGSTAEHFTSQTYNQTGWGWSAYVVGEYLLRLTEHLKDEQLKSAAADHCRRALAWCFNACQFDDGAHGMFGRDDKWVGMGAAAVLLYVAVKAADVMTAEFEAAYRPRAERSWRWLVRHTGEQFPADGYVRVTGTTSKKPLENLVWLMAWTAEALVAGGELFADP